MKGAIAVKTAAAYIRVSTDEQTEYSPDAQLRELQDFAASHDMLICSVYSDEGISGRRADKRPGFLKMISDARSKAHPFDVILVHKFDRFARNREDSIVYKSILRRCGVEVVSIKEPLSDGAYSGVMEAIYESFAEAYSINLGQEVRKGMTEKALRGEPQTSPPFGYRLENKRFVPHEEEADMVRQMFDRFLAGEGLYAIAKYVTSCGFRTHRGTPFENRTVEYILRNPVYIGKLRWNPKRRTRRNYSDPDVLTVPGHHTPIVSNEIFEQAQALIAVRKLAHPYHGRPSSDRKHWLCGVVRCPTCGATLVFVSPHYLKCNNYGRGRCPTSQHINLSIVDDAFLSRLREDLLPTSSPTIQSVAIASSTDKSNQLKQTVSRLEKKLERLTEAYLSEAIGLPEYKKLKASIEGELSTARNELEEALSPGTQIDTAAILRSRIQEALQTLTSTTATISQKYDTAMSLVESCYFDKSKMLLTITYRLTL